MRMTSKNTTADWSTDHASYACATSRCCSRLLWAGGTWGFTTALLYGGNIHVDKRSTLPPVLGGRGNLVGSYDQTLSVVLTVYGNWAL